MSKSVDTAIELKKSIESLRAKIEDGSRVKNNMQKICHNIEVVDYVSFKLEKSMSKMLMEDSIVKSSVEALIKKNLSETSIGKEIITIGNSYDKICNQIINTGVNELYYNLNDISIQLGKVYDDIKDSSVNKIKNNIQEIVSILNECKEKIQEYKK